MEPRYCRSRGSALELGALFCSSCGSKVSQAPPGPPPRHYYAPAVSRKDPMIALILGLFGIWGIGHIHLGKINRGVGFLLLGWLSPFIIILLLFGILVGGGPVAFGLLPLLIILLMALFVVFILHVYDAYSLFKRYNQAVERTGRAHW